METCSGALRPLRRTLQEAFSQPGRHSPHVLPQSLDEGRADAQPGVLKGHPFTLAKCTPCGPYGGPYHSCHIRNPYLCPSQGGHP